MNKAREIKQEEALQYFINSTLSATPYRVAYHKATGSGKTKVALDCADWYLRNITNGDGEIFIGANSESARDITWPQEIEKWLGWQYEGQYLCECYESFRNVKGHHFRVGIFDECHHLTEKNSVIFRQNRFDAIILLTAIEPRQQAKRHIINNLVGDNKYVLPIDLAVDLGILNKYKVYAHHLEMDREEKYISLFKFEKGVRYTEWEAYLRLMGYLESIKQKQPALIGQAYGKIMRTIGAFKSKTLACKYLMRRFQENHRRFIVFAANKQQCVYLSPFHMHSGTDDMWLQALLNESIDHLVNVEQLQENINVPNLHRSITVQILSTDPLVTAQQVGRIMRLEATETSIANILVYKNTYDITWFDKAVSKFKPDNIYKVDLDKEKYWTDEKIDLID